MQLAKVIRDEGVSGAKRLETRPGGAELVKLVRSKQVQAVLTLKLDRLFRDAADCLNQTRDWDQSGIALHVIDMGGSALNTASAVGRMFLTITAAFAELERNLIAERTSTALRHKRDNKKAYSPTPFGFDRDGDALATNSGEAEVVKLIQELHAKRWSLRAIAAELTRREIPTKQGKSWYASTVGKILANTIHQ